MAQDKNGVTVNHGDHVMIEVIIVGPITSDTVVCSYNGHRFSVPSKEVAVIPYAKQGMPPGVAEAMRDRNIGYASSDSDNDAE